ncbi:hypothetical protein HDK77DRAFT_509220 [Phyllosticta capitalensis]
MAPVDSDVANSNRDPLFAILFKVSLVAICLGAVASHLKKASQTLPPSHTTRARTERRTKNIKRLSALAIASLLVLLYHSTSALVASYDTWAKDNGEDTPGALWNGWYAGDEDWNWQLGRWWQDMRPAREFINVALGTSKGLWWTQQLLVAKQAFAAFAGIEGYRRDIPKLQILALWPIAEFAGLSVAQSLFFAMILLSPVSSQVSLSTPHPAVYLTVALASTASIWFLPNQGSSNVSNAAGISFYLLQAFLAVGVRILPKGLRKDHVNAHASRHSSSTIYRALAAVSLGFFVHRTFWGGVLKSEDRFRPSHNFIWNTHPYEERSVLAKLGSTISKLLEAIGDEPIISAVAWDVVLTGFTLCLWAAVRNLDVSEMLYSIVPLPRGATEDEKHVSFKQPTPQVKKEETTATSTSASPPKRGRGRPRKNSTAASTPAPSEKQSSQLNRRSLRNRAAADGDTAEDPDYEPTAATAAQLAQQDHDEEYDETVKEEAEAAALAWGLSIFGGLGLVSAAVMGAESRSR